jgi:hypothetical protein
MSINNGGLPTNNPELSPNQDSDTRFHTETSSLLNLTGRMLEKGSNSSSTQYNREVKEMAEAIREVAEGMSGSTPEEIARTIFIVALGPFATPEKKSDDDKGQPQS